MSDSNEFLKKIEEKVINLLQDTEFKIENVEHCSYLENYTFLKNELKTMISISYNNKGEISSVRTNNKDELSTEILSKLSVLKGHLVQVSPSTELSEAFLKEFDQNISEGIKQTDFKIVKLETISFGLKYTIEKNGEICVVIFNYNKNKVFTKARIEKNSELGNEFIEKFSNRF